MGEKFKALLDTHCVWLDDTVRQINDNMAVIMQDEQARSDALSEALMLTHQIMGTSGSMGFKEVSQTAALLEKQLELLEPAPDAFSTWDHEKSFALLNKMKMIADSTTPQSSSLFNVELG